MKVVMIAYDYFPAYHSPGEWIKRIGPIAGLMESLSRKCKVLYAGRINFSGVYSQNGVDYHFISTVKRRTRFPFAFHRAIKKLEPDIVMVLGLHFPLQVLQLRRNLNKKIQIVARHHGDKPPGGIKRWVQRKTDRCVDAYLFTTLLHAGDWIDAGIIRDEKKIHEVFEASTDFIPQSKAESKEKTGMKTGHHFLWVGRFNKNKDPLTVLSGFEKYATTDPSARLHMIFQETGLLEEVKSLISKSKWLQDAVLLHGFIPYDELPVWYSAADFYISGSHREGGSYALMEAMACGCLPIVTAIPASLKTIGHGKFGLSFEPGNGDELAAKLVEAVNIYNKDLYKSILTYFKENLSSPAIAAKMFSVFETLVVK